MKFLKASHQFTFSVFLGLLILFSSSCKKEEPSLRDTLIGDWNVEVANIEGLNTAPSNMSFEFEDDGEFDLSFVFNGNRFDMKGDWEVDESSQELELTYEIQDFVFVGLGGFFLNKDISREEYDIQKENNDDIEIEATVEGLDIELKMERD